MWTLSWRPASRSSSQSGSSATTSARLARIVAVALPRLRRNWVSASVRRAAAGTSPHPGDCPRRAETAVEFPEYPASQARSQHSLWSRVHLGWQLGASEHHGLLSCRGEDLRQMHRLGASTDPG